jgi:hypothetical protein
MNQQKWERDIVNRQRNIVFPDTNLNEGRFCRNIAYGRAVFSRGQKLSLLIVPAYYLIIASVELASIISQNKEQPPDLANDFRIFLVVLGGFLFWMFLAVKGLFPVERKRIVRGGYRSKRDRRG